MAAPQQRLGRRAEETTAAWLSSRGWHVLERRWRSASGEIDLVCLDPDGTLVGVEVKLRRTSRSGGPEEALDARRVVRLRRALADYAAQRRSSRRRCGSTWWRLRRPATCGALSRWPGVDQW